MSQMSLNLFSEYNRELIARPARNAQNDCALPGFRVKVLKWIM